MNNKDFWLRVNMLIKAKGTTQKALSSKLGFNERRIESLSSSNRMPDAYEALKISRALDVSLDYLLTGNESPLKEINTDILDVELDEIERRIQNIRFALKNIRHVPILSLPQTD